tara:strand:- start:101 stop:559 length:459 start_codon:yes stop_codon:yes gene_type:complete
MALTYAKVGGWTEVTNNITVADTDGAYYGDEISVVGSAVVLGEVNEETGAVAKWQYTLDDTPISVSGVGVDPSSSSGIGTKTWTDLEYEAVAIGDNTMEDLPFPSDAKGIRPAVTITASSYGGNTTIESKCLIESKKSDLGFSISGLGADPS